VNVLIRLATASAIVAACAVFGSAGCSGASSSPLTNPGSASGGSSGGGNGSGGSSGAGSSGSGGTSSSGSPGASSGGSSSGGSSSGTTSGSSSSSSSSSGSSSGGLEPTDAGNALLDAGPYPAGPYCQAAGSGGNLTAGCVLPNTTWIGYVDPTGSVLASTESYVSFSLQDARNLGRRYAMINVAEFDCPGCQNSATELEARAASVEQAGGLVIEVLETAGFTTQADMTDLTYWVTNYMLKNTTVKDPDGTGTPTLDFFGRRDQAYIVDLSTMTILQYIDGSIINATPSENSAGLAMDALLKLLGD
jgi:hypothetical protein